MGTRESAHDKTDAKGSCFSVVCCFRMARSCSQAVRRRAVKRLLPSINSWSAASGLSAVCARTRCGATTSMPTAVVNPATVPPTDIWRNLRRDELSLGTLGCKPQAEEDSGTGVWLHCLVLLPVER